MIYFIYFTLLLFIAAYGFQRQGRILSLIITFITFACTYPAGGDWIGYFLNYDCIENSICTVNTPTFEFGFNIFVSAFGGLGFLGYNALIVAFNVYAINRFSKKFENPAFIFFALMSFFSWVIYIEAIRQSIAISLLLIAIPYLFSKEKYKYALLIILATTFHTTALIGLIFLIPMISVRLSKLSSFGVLIVSIIFLVMPVVTLNMVYMLLQPGSIAQQKLSYYLSSEAYQPQFSAGIGTIFDFLLLFIVIKTYLNINKHNDFQKSSLNIIIPGVVLYFSFSIIIGKMMPVMTRIGWYGVPFLVILLSANISNSIFIKKINYRAKIPLIRIWLYLFLISQIARPLLYDHSRYGILNQTTIFQQINYLDDRGLYARAEQKCQVLHKMGLTFLCSI